jgi:NAD(P)-dependent dehydrogenase (short-subunit alcohol dehydrogenase family)
VAIVIGAGGELGHPTAEKLVAAGFTVAGVDRSEEALKELPDGIWRAAADPTDPAAARSVVDRIAAEVGPPEVLVNTIGTYLRVPKTSSVLVMATLIIETRLPIQSRASAPRRR